VIRLLENLFRPVSVEKQLQTINSRRQALADADDAAVKAAAKQSRSLTETIAVTAVAAERVLGIRMFDVQLQGALALAKGRIAEMQTGEGKTLAAVPAIVWYASHGNGIHVMTANDYLARRDAEWMGGIFRFLGLTIGCIQQDMSSDQRRSAYACDITYGTANEVGFDYLRDQLALFHKDQVHRNFYAALIDEADSILIDEARVPLVIAGDEKPTLSLAYRVDEVTRHFLNHTHFTVEEASRNIGLTDAGIRAIETAFDCGNLFELENAELHAAVQDSIHAHALLRRDVDYLVKNGVIESVDEFKGRIIQDRRWPGGLHTAIEAKEGVAPKKQGRVLGSITLQNLIALYPMVCGMTGTAATQASEFRKIYDLEVEVIPTNRPMIRIDHPDRVFRTMPEKEEALVKEIRSTHKTGQPLLVGTHSVEESERLSRQLIEIPHQVLNARNDEVEAAIVRRAGERGAVTISTNMAGRGTDIQLGTGVSELGGLYVIGTNRHESVRIDNQLRGRAGRQGDPGCSRFFVSYQDELLLKYGIDDETHSTPAEIQRRIEGQMLDIRQFLNKYERVAEGQRMAIQMRRQDLLDGTTPCKSELERLASLITIDDMWAEYLSALAEIRSGVHWVSLSGGARDPIQSFFKFGGFDAFREYLRKIHALFKELLVAIDEETPLRLANMELNGIDPTQRGSTWTYITTDQPFTTWVAKALRELLRKKRS
jgi:preprotein translocase subunit SecA